MMCAMCAMCAMCTMYVCMCERETDGEREREPLHTTIHRNELDVVVLMSVCLCFCVCWLVGWLVDWLIGFSLFGQ